jgi:MFS family permease
MSSSFSSSNSSIPPFVIKATAVASLGGILFGYDMGVISVAMPQLVQHFSLSDRQQEAVVGILYLGGGVGAAAGGSMCDRFGRWTSIVITDILFLIGAAVLIYAPSLNVLYAGRVIVGFAISVSGISDVAYLHELSPVQYRGAIVSVNEACISLGFLLAYIAGFLLSEVYPNHGWRVMFGLSGALAALQLIGMTCMPESPVWLHEQGYTEQAQQALRVIYGGQGDETRIPVLEDHVEHKPTAPKTSRIPPSPTGLDSLNSMEGRGSSRDELLAASGSVPTYESLDSKEQQRLRSLRVSAPRPALGSAVNLYCSHFTRYGPWSIAIANRSTLHFFCR